MRYCPRCKADLRGELIPAADRKYFSGRYFERTIALYKRDLDCTVAYQCPDCKYIWPRNQRTIDAVKEI
jgi:hypothetical protein